MTPLTSIIQVLFLFLLFCSSLAAQKDYKPYLLHWTEKDGLSDDYVYQIKQDPYGYLWLGSSNGLCRFDGNNFETFRYDPKDSSSVAANEIVQLHVAQNGNIWVGTDGGGLSRYDYQRGAFDKLYQQPAAPESSLSENRVYSFWEDDSKEMLIGYRAIGSGVGGLTVVDSNLTVRRHVLQNITDYAGFPMKVYHIFQTNRSKDIYWLGGRSLYRWNKKENSHQEFPHPGFKPNYNSISGIQSLNDSTLLVGLHFDGLWLFDTNKGKWLKRIHAKKISAFHFGKDQKIWLVDTDGVGWLDIENSTFQYELLRHGKNSPFPPKVGIHCINIIDDVLWLGTSNGIYAWSPIFQQFNTASMTTTQGPCVNLPEFVGSIDKNTWCFSAFGEGLVLTDSLMNLKRSIKLPADAKVRKALLIKESGATKVLIGTYNGLYLWNNVDQSIARFRTQHPTISTDSFEIWSMFYKDGFAWIGTRLSGLLKINLQTKEMIVFQHDPASPSSLCHDKYLFEIDEGPNGNIWVCTDNGLSIIDPKTNAFLQYPALKKLQAFVIHALEKDESGNMWIGTRDRGLFRYNLSTQELKQYTVSDGLSYNGVNKMLYKNGFLWLSTREGLCRMDIREEQIIVFDERKGLWDRTLYNSRLQSLEDGTIMLTYQNSCYFSLFTDQSLSADLNAPKVVINDLKIHSRTSQTQHFIYSEERIALGPHENYFTIEFQGLDFLQSEKIHYEYQLKNFNDYWIDAGNSTTAVFTNLPGGDYEFMVRAINPDGQQSEVERLQIQVATPWYKTKWFFVLAGLCLGLFVYGIYRYRIRQIRKQESFKQQLAELEMKALRSQINPHFIFNCLNSIKGYIIENKIEDGTQYIGRFAQLIRMILNHSKEKLIPLSQEIEAIRLYVWLEQERLSNGFDVDFELSFDNKVSSFFIPPLLFQPYIENAIWHGLMPLNKKGTLQIKIKELKEYLQIQIIDNGIGRTASNHRKQASIFKKNSLGLDLSKDRLRQINQLYDLHSSVEIKDYSPNEKNPGTLVTILFPKLNPKKNA